MLSILAHLNNISNVLQQAHLDELRQGARAEGEVAGGLANECADLCVLARLVEDARLRQREGEGNEGLEGLEAIADSADDGRGQIARPFAVAATATPSAGLLEPDELRHLLCPIAVAHLNILRVELCRVADSRLCPRLHIDRIVGDAPERREGGELPLRLAQRRPLRRLQLEHALVLIRRVGALAKGR